MEALWCILIALLGYVSAYPVPIPPGGRNAVHGWLILPKDQPASSINVSAWFVHHTPEV